MASANTSSATVQEQQTQTPPPQSQPQQSSSPTPSNATQPDLPPRPAQNRAQRPSPNRLRPAKAVVGKLLQDHHGANHRRGPIPLPGIAVPGARSAGLLTMRKMARLVSGAISDRQLSKGQGARTGRRARREQYRVSEVSGAVDG